MGTHYEASANGNEKDVDREKKSAYSFIVSCHQNYSSSACATKNKQISTTCGQEKQKQKMRL